MKPIQITGCHCPNRRRQSNVPGRATEAGEVMYTITEEQKQEIDLMLAYSNAVSMALRAPGGRSHSWTLGKIGHLYDQQCKVESIMRAIEKDNTCT